MSDVQTPSQSEGYCRVDFEAYGLFNLLDTEQSGNIECEVGRPPWWIAHSVQSNFLLFGETNQTWVDDFVSIKAMTGTVRRMFAIAGPCQCHRCGNPAVSWHQLDFHRYRYAQDSKRACSDWSLASGNLEVKSFSGRLILLRPEVFIQACLWVVERCTKEHSVAALHCNFC